MTDKNDKKTEEKTEKTEEKGVDKPEIEKKEEKKEAPSQKEKKEDSPKEEPKGEAKKEKQEKKPSKKLEGKLNKIAEEIEGLTILELADLSSYLEEKFGVSGYGAMATAPSAGAVQTPGSDSGAGGGGEAKSKFTVVLTDAGGNKLAVIKAVRELRQDLGLMDAKKVVEEAPKDILTDVKKEEAEAATKKLTDAGAKAEMK